ncbi:hypothetical protein BD309DRAFT_314401 [Dichomitus squalens]|nr:hypothetical protein BD309DRAFT_314401 [Dichomitus squalens]
MLRSCGVRAARRLCTLQISLPISRYAALLAFLRSRGILFCSHSNKSDACAGIVHTYILPRRPESLMSTRAFPGPTGSRIIARTAQVIRNRSP